MNGLPPGLAGWVLGDQHRQQRSANELGQLQGILGLQQAIEQQEINRVLKPLQVQQLQMQVKQAQQNAALRERLGQASQGSQPLSFGEGGMSLPGGGQGNVLTGQVAPQTPQGVLGGAVPPHLASILLSGDSGLTAYAKAELERTKPINVTEGGGVYIPGRGFVATRPKLGENVLPVTDQQGNVIGVREMPGAAGAAASVAGAVTGAQERSRSQYDLVNVPLSGGGSRQMSRLDALNALGSGRPSAEQQALSRVIDAEAQGRPASVTVPNQLGVTPPESDKTYSGERAKFYAERAGKLNDSWYTANELHSKLDLVQNLFSNPAVASGALAETVSDLKGVADSFGIQTTGKSSEDVIRAVTNEMAMRIKNAGGTNMMPGAMSDFEQKLLRSMVPNLAQSREGRALMVEVMRAKVLQDMKISELAANYEEQNGKLDSGFEREARSYLRQNPMFDQRKAEAMFELAKRLSGPKK